MSTFKGIDVSEHQGVIDWNKVKTSGIQFAMIRAGYGKGNIDKQFVHNISECNRLGIPCGVYWFSYAYTEDMARAEARHCLNAIKPYKLDYPIAFDFEYDSYNYAKRHGVVCSEKLVSDMIRDFCGEIEAAGRYALNYANGDYLSHYIDDNAERRYGLWIAAPDKKSPTKPCQIWQYSWAGKVNGINGNVDMNYAYVDFPAIINPKKEDKPVEQKEWYIEDGTWEEGKRLGIVDGNRPKSAATRAEVNAMILRAMRIEKEGK